MTHNISINVTDTDSPLGVRRRHLRSLSDVTPASRAATPRARSHSERPRVAPASAPAATAPPSPAAPALAPLPPRLAHSARTSPDASRDRINEPPTPPAPERPRLRDRLRGDTVGALDNPWHKMSDFDSRGALGRASLDGSRVLDPWVKNPSLRPGGGARDRASSRDDVARPTSDAETKRDETFRRGKLERKAAVVCESCGNESCECWRPRSPAPPAPRTPRPQRSLAAAGGSGAAVAVRCTCEARSPRPSPARLAPRQPVRAHSDDESRSRRLYKSASQKMICTSVENENAKKTVDPLLETTC